MRSALRIEGRLVVKTILEEFIIHVSSPSTANISYWLLDLSLHFHSSASMESKLSLYFLWLLWETLLNGLQIISFFSAFCQMLLYLFSWRIKVIVLLFNQRLLCILRPYCFSKSRPSSSIHNSKISISCLLVPYSQILAPVPSLHSTIHPPNLLPSDSLFLSPQLFISLRFTKATFAFSLSSWACVYL